MQVFGLLGHVIRNGRAASRLIDAETANIAAAIRRDAVVRWRQAIAKGLTAEDAARIVGVPRSTLYRWQRCPEFRSRGPLWTSDLVHAVEEPLNPDRGLTYWHTDALCHPARAGAVA